MKLFEEKHHGKLSWQTNEHVTSFRERERESKVPILAKVEDTYLLWHVYYVDMPKVTRQTLGSKVDALLLELIETIILAAYSKKPEKAAAVNKASTKLDAIKLFLELCWRVKGIDNKKYSNISQQLSDIGKMLGGWQRSLQ